MVDNPTKTNSNKTFKIEKEPIVQEDRYQNPSTNASVETRETAATDSARGCFSERGGDFITMSLVFLIKFFFFFYYREKLGNFELASLSCSGLCQTATLVLNCDSWWYDVVDDEVAYRRRRHFWLAFIRCV